MNYRAEIDGLRAIAVIPVIFFHAGFEAFGGGFIGVDVFFVISGYLITTIILTEQERGTFSLADFYERRARRILPALFLVMAALLPFAYAWLLPPDLKSFSQSLVAISTFTSNFYFWQTTGYWGASNEWIPMLHTWSLAVEEQYYFIFPLLLMSVWRYGRRWLLGTVLALSVISLLGSEWAAHQDPVANFFLLPTRAWELGIGATIAFYLLYRQPAMRRHRARRAAAEVLGLAGLAMIAFAVHAFDGTLPFPGFHALIPTLGAGLIILCASPQTLVGRLLGTRVLAGIGLISYSAYLWHQPLFAFARHRSLHEPSALLFSLLVLLTFLLAYCSWRYVEAPFRRAGTWDRRAVFAFAGTGLGVFLAIGMVGTTTDGFVSRTASSGETLAALKDKLKVNFGLSPACEGSFTLVEDCRTSDEPEILVWGDSYAMHLVQGILTSKPDAKIIQMTKSLCGPFFDIALVANPQYPLSWSEGCLAFSSGVRDWLRSNDTVKYVVLSANYENYFSKRNALLLRSGEVVDADIGVLERAFLNTLAELRLMGRSPVVFSPLPSTRDDLGRCLGRARWLGIDLEACSFPVTEISQSRQLAFGLLDGIEQKYPVVRLDELLCDDGMCRANLGSVFIYRDSGHFSREGSAAVGSEREFHHAIVSSTQSMAVTP